MYDFFLAMAEYDLKWFIDVTAKIKSLVEKYINKMLCLSIVMLRVLIFLHF